MHSAIVSSETVPFWQRCFVVLAVFLVPLALAILLFTVNFGPVSVVWLAAVLPAGAVTMFAARWLAPRASRSWSSSGSALAWGAGGALLLATVVGAWSAEQVSYVDDEYIVREAIPIMWVLTPLVEEVGKGLGVLFILLLARRRGRRGVLFGAMVGALVGVGFAVMEDASAIAAVVAESDLGSGVAMWIVRTLTFPTHAALTIWTGAALGLALDAGRAWSRPFLGFAGLAVASVAHGAINYGNVAGDTDQASFFTSLGTAFGWILMTTVLAVTLRLVLTRRRA